MKSSRLVRLALHHRVVSLTVIVGAAGAILWFTTPHLVVQILFSAFALAIAVVVAVCMVKDMLHGRLGVDILAVIAIVATVVVGEYLASMIIVLMVSGGKALEDFADSKARRDLSALLAREPQVAHLLGPATAPSAETGSEAGSETVTEIAAADVVVGDRVLVRSGEVVPVDGVLESPSASFDESSLTGESMPVERVQGDIVLSGSINGLRAATMTATATAANSQFQGIIALVAAAQKNRAPVVRLADRYAIPFTLVSLALGVGAWVVSGNPVRFAEVLVLATPCPLLLAAPVAFMGGMSRAARNGVIVKGGGVLESLARIRTAVFDKTGTLTHGTPTVSRITAHAPFDETTVLALAASCEQYSSHVLASSIVAEAQRRGIALQDVTESSESEARGISAIVGSRRVSLGSLAFVRASDPSAPQQDIQGGELAIYVTVDDRYAGVIVASDPVRENAAATVAALRARGVLDVVMLTGDAAATAQHVAHSVGITTVRADCLPVDKVNAVLKLTDRPVLMVGDGVNDAPVLAAAEVGIAMGAKGATAASESAAAVILVDDLSRVARAVDIGADTVRIALQSIWIGIALSVGLMIVAAFGFIPAAVGAGIQELVDLATILNALRAVRDRDATRRSTARA